MMTICQAENLMIYCTGSRVKSRERATIFLQQWYPTTHRRAELYVLTPQLEPEIIAIKKTCFSQIKTTQFSLSFTSSTDTVTTLIGQYTYMVGGLTTQTQLLYASLTMVACSPAHPLMTQGPRWPPADIPRKKKIVSKQALDRQKNLIYQIQQNCRILIQGLLEFQSQE